MTIEQQQVIVDRAMHVMAERHGSSKRRDYEVASLVLDLVGSATVSANSAATGPMSPAQKSDSQIGNSLSPGLAPEKNPVGSAPPIARELRAESVPQTMEQRLERIQADLLMVDACLRNVGTDPLAWCDSALERVKSLRSSLVASEDAGQKRETELMRAPTSLSPAVEPLTNATTNRASSMLHPYRKLPRAVEGFEECCADCGEKPGHNHHAIKIP